MSENHRSLASYFDSPPARNWHEQTEPLAGGHHDIPDFGMSDDEESDGLHAGMLGSWMWHPDHTKQVWVPDGVHSVFDIPAGEVYQEKGNTQWPTNAWGADDYKVRHDMAHAGKGSRPKETKDERKTRRDKLAEILKEARAEATKIVLESQDFVPSTLLMILNTTINQKAKLTAVKNDELAQLKQSGKVGAEKNKKLHELTTGILHKQDQNWSKMLKELDGYCKQNNLENILGTDLPPSAADGKTYLFVALSFLSQVKKLIMTGVLAIARAEIKKGNKAEFLYEYVNYSYLANDQRKRLTKDRYPKNPKKGLPDSEQLATWEKHLRDLEREAFKKLHPKAKIPKRLKDNTGKRQGKKGKGKKGKGSGGNSIVVTPDGQGGIHIKPAGDGHHNNKGKKHHHHEQKRHTFGHGRREPEHGVAPAPGYYEPPEEYSPWRQPQPPQIPVYARNRMQRNYY